MSLEAAGQLSNLSQRWTGTVRLEFVNHASYVLDASKQGVRLLTDPWMEGNAFNNGWAPAGQDRLPL